MSATNRPIVPTLDEYRAFGEMRIGRGNRSTRRKPAPAPFCAPQIPHELTRTAAVRSRQITAWAGRTISQAVSRWLLTAAARVRARVWQVGFVVDKVALGQVFSKYFVFPSQSSFHQILHLHNHSEQVQ
jgi:hypothetical protein